MAAVLPGQRLEKSFAAFFSKMEVSEIKKRFCPHHGTKAKASAIPPKLTFPGKCPLATRTIIRAPMDNGWGPVSPYLEYSVQSRPPKPIHQLSHIPFPPSGTLCGLTSASYYSSSQVFMYNVTGIICASWAVCQQLFGKKSRSEDSGMREH